MLGLVLPVLLQLPQPVGPAGGLSGRFYDGERSHGIPGALVALYEKGTGLLVDSTYTREFGEFTLRPPPHGGAFLEVATKDATSKTRDLIYDPRRPAMDASITYLPEQTPRAQLERFFSGKFGSFLLGLAGGWLFNLMTSWCAAHQKAKTVLKAYLHELKTEVNAAAEAVKKDLAALGVEATWNQVTGDRYREIMEQMAKAAGYIEERLHAKSIEEDLYVIHRSRGLDELSDFRQRLRDVRDAIKPAAKVSGEEMKGALKKLQTTVSDLERLQLLQR